MYDETKTFLSLMNLARKRDQDSLAQVRLHFPNRSDEELFELAEQAEEQRNRDILMAAVRVPPTRKVSCWTQDGPAATAILECGHIARVRLNQTSRVVRCRRCLEEENRDIVENLSGQVEHAGGGT